MSNCIALATIAMGDAAGGIERNIVYLANYIAEQDGKVVLLSFDQPHANAFYDFDIRVTWEKLGRTKPHDSIRFWQRLTLIARIRQALVKYDVRTVVCFHHGILVRFLAAMLFRRVRVICSERNSLAMYGHIRLGKWNPNFLAMFLVDAVTVQFPSYVRQYPRLLRRKIHVVHNPVFPPGKVNAAGRIPMILSVGRHQAQKRFDLLVRAFYLVSPEFPEWRLTIVGSGPFKPSLESLVQDLGLTQKVDLPPATRELHRYFQEATIYCQPSLWEGFPNAQAEAMAAGVIPVGFQATDGVADLIEDGVNGALATGALTAENLATALRRVMAAPKSWPELSAKAQTISATYTPELWQRRWNGLLGEMNV